MCKIALRIGRLPFQRSFEYQVNFLLANEYLILARQKRWQPLSPWVVYQFMEGLSDSLSFYNLPMWWWKRARTNNPVERLIKTLRQRLRPMGCFHDDPAIERAVFGQLLRWHKIKLIYKMFAFSENFLSL